MVGQLLLLQNNNQITNFIFSKKKLILFICFLIKFVYIPRRTSKYLVMYLKKLVTIKSTLNNTKNITKGEASLW